VTTADLLGVPHAIKVGDTEYSVRKPDLVTQGKFQRWLEQRARESVDRASYLDPDDRRAAQNAITREVAAGVYSWDGPVAIQAQQTPEGVAKILTLVTADPDGRPMDAATAEAAVAQELQRFVDLLTAQADDDPKALAAALTAVGLPATFLTARPSPGPKKSGSSASKTRRSAKRKRKSGR
jgi:hypothetical protein